MPNMPGWQRLSFNNLLSNMAGINNYLIEFFIVSSSGVLIGFIINV